MDELEGMLERCRLAGGGRVAALVGRDGLVIEASGTAGGDLDLALAAAEATDLLTVADRLFADALDAPAAREAWCGGDGGSLLARRVGDGAFALLVLPEVADLGAARAALEAEAAALAAVLA